MIEEIIAGLQLTIPHLARVDVCPVVSRVEQRPVGKEAVVCSTRIVFVALIYSFLYFQ